MISWATEGIKTNPLINQVIADTGPLEGGAHRFKVFVASSVVCMVHVEWRDALNAVKKSQALVCVVNGNVQLDPGIQFGDFADGERVCVRMNANVTGLVQASIFSE